MPAIAAFPATSGDHMATKISKAKNNKVKITCGTTNGEFVEKKGRAIAIPDSPASTAASGPFSPASTVVTFPDSDSERSEATTPKRKPMLPAVVLRRRVSLGPSESSEAAARRAVEAAAAAAKELGEEDDTPRSVAEEPQSALPAGVPSLGSAAHATGECMPCPWFWKPGGCQNSASCKRCHLCPEGELKNRKKTKHAMFRLGLATPKAKGGAAEETPRHVWFADKEIDSCAAEMVEVTPPGARDAREEPGCATISFSVETEAASLDAPESAPLAAEVVEPPGLSFEVAAPPGLLFASDPIEPPPGLQQPQSSRGSKLHDVGQCQPCAWFWKPSGCTLGADCERCHLCADGELKARKRQKHALLSLGLLTPKSAGSTKPARPTFGKEPVPAAHDSDLGSTTASEDSAGTGSGSDSEAGRAPVGDHGQQQHQQQGAALADTQRSDHPVDAACQQDVAAPPGAKNADGSVLPVPPGLAPPSDTPSHGSIFHSTGNCHPCAWFWKPGRCQNGLNCGYCHLCPESELKARKKAKQTQMRLGLATPKTATQKGAGSALSADAPEFRMPAAGEFSVDAPVFQPNGDSPTFQFEDARISNPEIHCQARALERIGLATPKAARVRTPGFTLTLAGTV